MSFSVISARAAYPQHVGAGSGPRSANSTRWASSFTTPTLRAPRALRAKELYAARPAVRDLAARAAEASQAGTKATAAKKSDGKWGQVQELHARGEVVTCRIEKANRGGVILRVSGVAGFVPASQIKPTRLGGEGDLTAQLETLVGQEISALIIQCDPATRQLVLSERQTMVRERMQRLVVGQEVVGRVESIVDFGAFVEIQDDDGTWQGVDGLVHSSELSWQNVTHPSDVVELGEEVNAKIIALDSEKMRISLSIRATQPDPLQETLDTLMPIQKGKWEGKEGVEPMPGLADICEALRRAEGIEDVETGRMAVEQSVVSQDLQLWITSEPVEDGYNLLARAGRLVQEVHVVTELSREEMKTAVMEATAAV